VVRSKIGEEVTGLISRMAQRRNHDTRSKGTKRLGAKGFFSDVEAVFFALLLILTAS
jgi:hypothetical protein